MTRTKFRKVTSSFGDLEDGPAWAVVTWSLSRAACMYGKATKRQWQHKSPHNKDESVTPTRPGQVISVDQMKSLFEHYCAQHGVKVQHYHADNGIFRAHKWVLDCRAKGQGLTLAGVNAHHQNGRAEAYIR